MEELIARTGITRGGLPVSVNAAPPADLAPFVARLFVTIIDQPDEAVLEDRLLNETALVRVLVRGAWEAWVPHRGWRAYGGALMFGAQRRALHVRVRGPIAVAGFAIRPGGWFGFEDAPADRFADQLAPVAGDWGAALVAACAEIDDHHATVERLIAAARDRVASLGRPHSVVAEAFERIAWLDPAITVAEAGRRLGLAPRSLDRVVRRHFGHLPKTILRRSRFLDLAAVMRGLAVPDADAMAETRFYDASHRNREFRLFVDMTPAQFERTRTPLLTPGLEVRQQRKLQDAAATDGAAPWLA